MDCRDLLAVLAAFQRESVSYVIVGALARTLRGSVNLGECIEIAVDPESVADAREVFRHFWPGAEAEDSPSNDVIWRFLPPDSPMYVDLVPISRTDLQTECLFIEGVAIRVANEIDDTHEDTDKKWTSPGFSLRERVNALNSLLGGLLPERRIPRGVRKYRSNIEADYDRNEWNAERFARLRRACASN
jgi:hypothetical protein